ncbi:MAG TPA: sodium-independent anion transporter, partial [Sphingobacteriaceae bacterium]|nr:sodium-independent anion transporter [Sphingobacteriaceae bacterium]
AKRIRARKHINESGAKVYEIYGPLFFGSVSAFLEKFDVENDPFDVIIDFKDSRVADMSAIDALHKITAKYAALDKRVVLKHLSQDCRNKLEKAEAVIEVTIEEDPTYKVMSNK